MARSAGVVRSANSVGLTTPSAPSAHPPLLCEEGNVLILYLPACGASLVILKFGNPFGWLRLFGTDYLFGFIFLTGMFLTVAALYDRTSAVIDRSYGFD